MTGSLVLVDEFTVSSAVANVIIGGGSSGSSSENFAIDSTYDVYMLQYNNLFMSVDGRVPQIRFTVSGSADTSSNYDNARMNLYSNQAFYDGANQNVSYMPNLSGGITSPESQQGTIYLFNFSNASEYSYATLELVGATETPEYYGVAGGFVLTVAQATDGVQFYANADNIASGEFKLYGLKK
jgi:hypothetical protein